MLKRVSGFFVILCLVGATGCTKPGKQQKKSGKSATDKKIHVKLPPVQDLRVPPYTKYYADQSLTVQHLMRNVARYTKSGAGVVAVTGVLTGLIVCAKKGRCTRTPHFFLVDTAGAQDFRLRVVDLPEEKMAEFKENNRFRIEGSVVRFSKDGQFIDFRGLLSYKSGSNLDAPKTPPGGENQPKDKPGKK